MIVAFVWMISLRDIIVSSIFKRICPSLCANNSQYNCITYIQLYVCMHACIHLSICLYIYIVVMHHILFICLYVDEIKDDSSPQLFLNSVTINTNAYISYVCLNSLPYITKRTISGLKDGLILSIFLLSNCPTLFAKCLYYFTFSLTTYNCSFPLYLSQHFLLLHFKIIAIVTRIKWNLNIALA